uniref:Uncharacterized protein n=2 Tax=Cacopsylla melanoneura TaxID=428564 RepID=A0A8D8XS55_9HEMI
MSTHTVTFIGRFHQFTMDPPGDDLLFLSLFILIIANRNRTNKRKKRKQWCKEWLQRRNKYTHINLLKELTCEPNDFHNYFRMKESVYNHLLSLVSPLITKKDTHLRAAISPHERLNLKKPPYTVQSDLMSCQI